MVIGGWGLGARVETDDIVSKSKSTTDTTAATSSTQESARVMLRHAAVTLSLALSSGFTQRLLSLATHTSY